MNLYAESAESQLLIEIQGLNNCIFGKHNNLQCFYFWSRVFMAGAASQAETLTPPGHLVSPLVCKGSVNVYRGALLLVPQ